MRPAPALPVGNSEQSQSSQPSTDPWATSKTSETHLDVGSSGANLTHNATETTGAGDMSTARSVDWALGYVEGQVQALLGDKTEMMVGNDKVSSESRATLKGGAFDAEHKTASKTTDPDLGGHVTESKERAQGLSVDKGVVGVSSSNKESTEVDGQTFAKQRSMSAATDGSFNVASGQSQSKKDDTGTQSHSSDWAAGWVDGHASASVGQTSSSKIKDPELGGHVTESKDSAQKLALDKGKVTASSSNENVTEVDGESFGRKRSMQASSDGTFAVSSGKSYAKGEEQSSSTANSLAYDGKKLAFENSSSSASKDPDLGGKVAESKNTKNSASFDGKKVELGRTNKSETVVDGEKFGTESGTSIGSDGSVTRSSKNTKVVKDGDGERTSSTGNNFSAGTDGGSAGRSWENKNADGSGSKSSLKASVDTKAGTGTVAGGHDVTTKNGTTAGAKGSMTLDEHGNLTGAAGGASVKTKGGWSASVSGGYKVQASEPRAEGDHFVVDWSREATGALGGGKSGGKIGMSGSVEKSEKDFGTRMFKTKLEAENFRKNAAAMIGGAFGAQTTVDGALAMGVGESRGVGDTSKLGGDVSVSFGVADFSAGGSKSSEDAVLVERLSPTIFQITVAQKSGDEEHAGMGIQGVGAQGYQSDSKSHSMSVQFDLSTAEGKSAFEEYQRTKVVPKQGGDVVSETDAKDARHGTRLSYGPAGSAEFGANQWENLTQTKDGTKKVFGGENSEAFISNIPFFKGHDSASLNIVATVMNDTDKTYSMQGNVDSTDGDYSQQQLAKMTGTHTDGGAHASSGKWTVDVNIDEQIVDKFLGAMAGEKVRDPSIFEKLANPDFKNELRKQLQEAKTPDDKMRALSYFISESGLHSHEGIDAMREEVFGMDSANPWDINAKVAGTFHSDLKLEKDPHHVFAGLEGRLATEKKINDYAGLLKASDKGGAALVGPMQADMAELERKITVLGDAKNYTDLPAELRQMQIDTFQHEMDSLRSLRNMAAKEGVKDLGPDEEGKDTTDPRMKELRALRKRVGTMDDQIAAHKEHIAYLKTQVTGIPRNADPADLHDAYEGVKQGDAQNQAAVLLEPNADDARAGFVTALDDPDTALAMGSTCLAQLGALDNQLAAAESGYQKMESLKLNSE